ncbi:hypothetical protein AGMMS49983_19670 [Clostridia bacterium]|nr:hypothetical protein AGMMS49983_19620 [Clostridia bacterium]GHU67864.1 hypothetical protein AGMMS49983_19670 [Clostridia bacterium]
MHGRVFKEKKSSGVVKTAGFVAAVIIILILIYWALGSLGTTQEEKQIEIAQDAIVKAAVQCYALESRYPTGLKYLEDNYGLTLDTDKYIYHYRTIGSNMVPEVRVYSKSGSTGG